MSSDIIFSASKDVHYAIILLHLSCSILKGTWIGTKAKGREDVGARVHKMVCGVKTDRGEAQDHVEVPPDSGDEVIVEVVKGGGLPGQLLFHHRDEILGDFIQLISGKEIRYLRHMTHITSLLEKK